MRIAALVTLAATILGSPCALALDVGDAAPPLQVKTWVSNSPVTAATTKGKVLVVDFWATWCQPCRQTVQRINRLHKKYGAKGVVFVGITEEDEPAVKKFMGAVAMDYHVGLDNAGMTNNGYMKGVPGVPHSFVVDREGRVAWHGHPLSRLEQVVEELVAGKYDLARAKKLVALRQKLAPALRARDPGKIIEVLDETIQAVPDDPDAYRLKRALLRDQGKLDETWPVLLAMAQGCPKDADALLEAALALSTTGDLEHRDLPKAMQFAQQAVEAAGGSRAAVFAVLARVHYELGHVALAVDAVAKAGALAEGEERKGLEAQAAFYRKELERRRKDPDAK
ncbi:MAG TPA: TlpA disulfide reductase family protein [Planctomycetota bacterium]|nr:TlpA disulfide reductase family protein [Planctomycetota bacterium]